MSPRILPKLLCGALLVGACAALASGCAAQQRQSLRVVSIENTAHRPVLLVQVTNPERRSIRLQRLAYTFGGAEHTTRGEVVLSRDVAAGAAVIVEVPVQFEGHGPFTLHGDLTALLDRIVRTYPITASVPDEPAAP